MFTRKLGKALTLLLVTGFVTLFVGYLAPVFVLPLALWSYSAAKPIRNGLQWLGLTFRRAMAIAWGVALIVFVLLALWRYKHPSEQGLILGGVTSIQQSLRDLSDAVKKIGDGVGRLQDKGPGVDARRNQPRPQRPETQTPQDIPATPPPEKNQNQAAKPQPPSAPPAKTSEQVAPVAGPLGLECEVATLPVGSANERVPTLAFQDNDFLNIIEYWGLKIETTIPGMSFNAYRCDLRNFGSTAVINVALEFEWMFQSVGANGGSGGVVSHRKRVVKFSKSLTSAVPYRFWAVNFVGMWLNFQPTGEAEAQRVDADVPERVTLRQTGTPAYTLAPRAFPTQ